MSVTRKEKQKHALEIFRMIYDCETEDDVYQLDDTLDDLVTCGYIFKKDYRFLSEELDSQLMRIIDKQFKSKSKEVLSF